ncbi:MAG: TetR/AcrR family transcriptional regulator [Desulfobacteraceae bacterium]|jgi:TetR/AcrR family transcriptional regulator, transcriptional repressor for nem operon|nr:TetR/AcrR family transcriptional regulator [Desulfobacteraceae bacterium]MDH3573786.1 TetR/AcrR family transcriptional regulator [Desulfobacteraceae bacterium]MDH3721594.1 TetR/AcrR family transcriptional regulator [Desulfobacteraceae bacterium]MDH3836925.1 TetR/AcrR family transcriptional regulator [Desulfobacteraceae bacterium]MDH3875195.1 TetR/AcrR family transcriptional regulator [Desulfobacteraceae bacterium]
MTLKEKIIHESLRQFSTKGFLSTSITDILDAVGTSKGGFYNHFESKEALFFHVMDKARSIWRDRNLAGLDQIEDPVDKIKQLLKNFYKRYLKDSENFPGGCVFITLMVELIDQRPHLANDINKGWVGFKRFIQRHLEAGKATGKLRSDVNTEAVTEILFAGILGASVNFNVEKSDGSLEKTVNSLIDYLENLRP